MSVSQHNKWVTLSHCPQTDADAAVQNFTPLTPPGVWCAIQPSYGTDGRSTEHLVEMRFHPEVTIDTRIVYVDPNRPVDKRTRELFVRGVQNIDEANDLMRLTVEEITP